jgi:hypothetical protein
MRKCVHLYAGVTNRKPQDFHGFWHNAGGNVLISGFIFSRGGDD